MVMQLIQDEVLLTFKEAMSYLRVSRSTLKDCPSASNCPFRYRENPHHQYLSI